LISDDEERSASKLIALSRFGRIADKQDLDGRYQRWKSMSSRIYHKAVANDQFPEIREHFQKNIGDVYKGLDLDFRGFPESNIRDAEACTYPFLPMTITDG
jgi:hypothetical protein